MRIAEVNMMHNGSTGKIMFGVADCVREKGHIARSFSPVVYYRGRQMMKPEHAGHLYFGTRFENMLHLILAELTGLQGCFSFFGTMHLIRELKRFKPDVIHLHNLHNFTFHLPLLFRYIKKNHIKVVWTLHDCWTFTGKCPHFVLAKCDRWKTGCHDCTQVRGYPKSLVDRSKTMWKLKKKWFTGVEDLTIVAPSQWLAELVKESYLASYPVQVIYNGIDLRIFQPTDSDFRAKYHLEDKKIILGVAFSWDYAKGLDVFVELSKRLPEQYKIVLVGTNDLVDSQLPPEIISIHATENQRQLAEIYSAADVFANFTRQDTLPTVNIEALACGTPVLTFRTGGSPEILNDACGSVVRCDDVDAAEKELIRICSQQPYSQEDCLARAKEFNMYARFSEYAALCTK